MSDLSSNLSYIVAIFTLHCGRVINLLAIRSRVHLLPFAMKITLLVLGWLFAMGYPLLGQPAAAPGANITIQLDFESAKAIIGLLTKAKVTDTELNQVAKLYGSQQLIEKVTSYDNTGTEAVFKQTLREIIETGTVNGKDPFEWKIVKTNLGAVQHMISELEAKGLFLEDVKRCILPYCPPTSQVTARACFLVGGVALGFTLGHDDTFNVALQKIGDNYEGLVSLVAHELYHTVQLVGERGRKKETLAGNLPKPVATASMLLTNLWSEGTAQLVGDVTIPGKPTSFMQRQSEYQRNRQRMRSNFALFESLLFSAYYDSTAKAGNLYNIGFTTSFDQTAYYTGYQMAKEIETHKGKAVLAALVNQSPLDFCRLYIQLYKEHPDKINYKFSPAMEAIIAKLAPWQDKI